MQSNNTVIISCAGSGKTYDICRRARQSHKENKRILLVTYTNRGKDSIAHEYEKQNLGVIDSFIDVKTWYQFLLSELIKPYQSNFFGDINILRSIDFQEQYGYVNYKKTDDPSRYINRNNDINSNEVARLAFLLNNKSKEKTIRRLEEIYSNIFIDEVQDLAGDDLNILEMLFDSSIHVTCVGDPKQSTFKTYNTKKYRSKTGGNILSYFTHLQTTGILQIITSDESRRCNQGICKLANKVNPNEPTMKSINNESTGHDGVFIIQESDINHYIQSFRPQILVYDKNSAIEGYQSLNFGISKGMTFERVLIISNGPISKFLEENHVLNSNHKYYVAVTRAKFSVCFAVKKLKKYSGFTEHNIHLMDGVIMKGFIMNN